MFWKQKHTGFKTGDTVKFKANVRINYSEDTAFSNWYGRVVAVEDDDIKMELDSITLQELPDEYLKRCIEMNLNPREKIVPKNFVEHTSPRDSQEETKAAKNDLLERLDAIDKVPKNRMEYNKWVRHFEASESGKALGQEERKLAHFFLGNFYDGMKKYEKKVPSNWTATSVKNVLIKWIPSRVWGTDKMFRAYGNIILAFFEFLHEKDYRNTTKLIPAVLESKDEMLIESQKSGKWTDDKRGYMEALEAGVDMNDKAALHTFLLKRTFGKIHESIDGAIQAADRLYEHFRQPDHPPIDPFIKEESDDPFIHLKRNQKITVKYPNGTTKENVKFKDVKKDLYEGLCELIKK